MTKSEAYFISKGYKIKGAKICENCGHEFNIYLIRDLQRKKFCSRKCRSSKNIRLDLMVKPNRRSKESYKAWGQKYRGENHWSWIKDRSLLKRSRFDNSERIGEQTIMGICAWRSDVYKRDNYTCQHCNQVGGRLNAHHIKSWADFPELRFDINNGITLCEKCHRREHQKLKMENQNAIST